MTDLTQHDCDRLADIIWWINGRQSACKDGDEYCELTAAHTETLRKFRTDYLERESGKKGKK